MRWLLSIVAIAALTCAWVGDSAAWLGTCLFIGIVAAIASTLAFAQARIESRSQPEILSVSELHALKAALNAERKAPDTDQRWTSS